MKQRDKKKMTWNDVTLYQFMELQKILQVEDGFERMCAIAELLLGDEVTNLPMHDFNEAVKQLEFLQTDIPTHVPPKKVEINGHKYFVDCLLGNVTTAQYVDFTNHQKSDKMANLLSVFIIPDGHKYNDGYDMEEVIKDIWCLPIPTVTDIAFFFGRQFAKFMKIFQSYSIKNLKKTNLPTETKEKLMKVVESSVDLALFPLS